MTYLTQQLKCQHSILDSYLFFPFGTIGNIAQRNIGFCPQNDYLPEYLNVFECLHLFARLKGLYFEAAKKSIDDIMKLFKLTEHKSKLVKNLR